MTALVQHMRLQYILPSSLDPTHWTNTTFLILPAGNSLVLSMFSNSTRLTMREDLPYRYSSVLCSSPPVATITMPCSTFSPSPSPPEAIVVSKLPTYPEIPSILLEVNTRTFSFSCTRRIVSARKACGSLLSKLKNIFLMFPPSSSSFSTRNTSCPASASDSAAVIPARPPPTTSARGSISIGSLLSESSRLAFATAISTRSFDFVVASSGSSICAQEHWSLILAISKR